MMTVAGSATLPRSIQPGRVQIFSGLGPEEMNRIATHARSLRKARGEFIYMPGDRADFRLHPETGKSKAVGACRIGQRDCDRHHSAR